MSLPADLLALLDSRSFGTPWFWLLLVAAWTATGREILGVPVETVARAQAALRDRGAPGPRPAGGRVEHAEIPEAVMLLDWLSLQLPRWRMAPRTGATLAALSGFGLATLAALGFGFDLEMAQALTLLLAPLVALFWLRVRLARRLQGLLAAAGPPAPDSNEIAGAALREIGMFRVLSLMLSIAAVAGTAFYGTLWLILHPNGL